MAKLEVPVLVPCDGEADENGLCRHHPGTTSPHRVERHDSSCCYCRTNFYMWPWCSLMGPIGDCPRRSEEPAALTRKRIFGDPDFGTQALLARQLYDVDATVRCLSESRVILERQRATVMGAAFSEEERPRYLHVLDASLKVIDEAEVEISAHGWIGLGDQIC